MWSVRARLRSRVLEKEPERWYTWNAFESAPVKELVGCGVYKYGEKFVWSREHWTKESLEPYRSIGDPIAEAALKSKDPMAALMEIAEPDWVDAAAVRRGQRVMSLYFPLVGMSLFYISLVGGFSAAEIVRTLEATGGLTGPPVAILARLARTGDFVLRVATEENLEKLKACCCRIRLVHAKVRARLTWSDHVAANQEDSAATLLAFSYNVLVGVEVLAGRPLEKPDRDAFLHLWRYVGFFLGVHPDFLDALKSEASARALLESIVMHILQPDDRSIRFAHRLLAVPGSFRYRATWCRLLLGHSLADALHLPRLPWYAPSRLRVFFVQLFLIRPYVACLRLPLFARALLAFHNFAARTLLRARRRRSSSPS